MHWSREVKYTPTTDTDENKSFAEFNKQRIGSVPVASDTFCELIKYTLLYSSLLYLFFLCYALFWILFF